ncbi:MAG: HXXEE domain-containing protein, partial [Gemmatimonadetes bacterium]|nr:HXXEE domain-containing protein [Gemmatimonadota bacterium]
RKLSREDRMTASEPDRPPAAPRAVILLPFALLLHQAEEWFGGFPTWSAAILGSEISSERFLLINALGLVVFVVGSLAALGSPQMAWFGVSLAALVSLNGVLHGIASLATGSYSPGTVTGLVLYIPLSAIVLRSSSRRLSKTVFAGSVLFGVLVHALATFSALR